MADVQRERVKSRENTDHRTPIYDGGIADREIKYSPSLGFLQGLFSVFMIIFIVEQFQKERPEISLRPSVFGFKLD